MSPESSKLRNNREIPWFVPKIPIPMKFILGKAYLRPDAKALTLEICQSIKLTDRTVFLSETRKSDLIQVPIDFNLISSNIILKNVHLTMDVGADRNALIGRVLLTFSDVPRRRMIKSVRPRAFR